MTNTRIEPLKKILERDPQDEVAWFGLGKAYLKDKNYPEAISALERCLELKPTYSAAYLALAQAFFKQNNTAKCRLSCRKGITVSASNGDLMVKKQLEHLLHFLPEE